MHPLSRSFLHWEACITSVRSTGNMEMFSVPVRTTVPDTSTVGRAPREWEHMGKCTEIICFGAIHIAPEFSSIKVCRGTTFPHPKGQ